MIIHPSDIFCAQPTVLFSCIFIFIFSDLVDGLILLMESNYSDPVNLGNPDEYTMLDFANIILEEVGKQMSSREIYSIHDAQRGRIRD